MSGTTPDSLMAWLRDVNGGTWSDLARAARSGIPVPEGFLVHPATPEAAVRHAYSTLKHRSHTHFVAIRSAEMTRLDVYGPDRLVHALRQQWSEHHSTEALVQRMVTSTHSGQAGYQGKNLKILAAAGMMVFEPDSYLVSLASRRCLRKSLPEFQRQMIRAFDGATRIIERQAPAGLETAQLRRITDLAVTVSELFGERRAVSWALGENKIWLLQVGSSVD